MDNKEGWRLIEDRPRDACANMAIDEAIFIAFEKGLVPKTIRLYGWNPPAISVGCFQKISKLFDQKRLEEISLDLVRRPTGGRAVFHEEELTYSIVSGLDTFSESSIVESYRIISHALIKGLKNLGISAEISSRKKRGSGMVSASCFSSPSLYEVLVQGKKVIGSAQKRSKKGLLQQGSILLNLDRERWTTIFNSADNTMISLQEILNRKISSQEVSEALIMAISESIGALFHGELTPFEKKISERLKKEKYSTKEWNFQR